MELNRIFLKKIKTPETYTMEVSESLDRDTVFLTIKYLKGKFTLEKTFRNTVLGREDMEKAIKEYNSEEKIKQHFGL